MKKTVAFLAAAVLLVVVYVIGFGQAKQPKAKKATFASADQATYKEIVPGASRATLWGDPDKGRFGSFVKFVPGFDAGMHTHTNDNWLVVIKGAYLYRDDDGEKRVGPGEFLRIPGGHKHWSGGDSTEGALFYNEGSGKFDLIPAK
ncbi:MAG: DUF4437 domain-containing protein [candidate division Zixibacteria bacterium]|nr:DUF4437 domain-containing protein [candidate division Zixibacteria bacterium]